MVNLISMGVDNQDKPDGVSVIGFERWHEAGWRPNVSKDVIKDQVQG